MNYRHAYHAGNFADVFKHIILARLLEYMKVKDKPFRVFDTHSGIGLYDLGSEQAGKTGEWQSGVKRIMDAQPPAAVNRLIGSPGKMRFALWAKVIIPALPASPTRCCEKLTASPCLSCMRKTAKKLKQEFQGDYQTRVYDSDGWLASTGHIPPKEKRGVMLVDPPFEDGKDL